MDRYFLSEDFVEYIRQTYRMLSGEDETKNKLIEPLLSRLGYDIACVSDIRTEVACGMGIKKEKADYIINFNNKPIIIVEAKDCKLSLDSEKTNQLFRYFCSENCKLGILTNGLQYWFFSDFQRENIMDSKPFHIMNVLNPTDEDEQVLNSVCKVKQCTYNVEQWILERKIKRFLHNKTALSELLFPVFSPQRGNLNCSQLCQAIQTALT